MCFFLLFPFVSCHVVWMMLVQPSSWPHPPDRHHQKPWWMVGIYASTEDQFEWGCLMLLNVGCVVSYLPLNLMWCASCNSTSHVTDLVESAWRKRRKLHVAVDLRHLRQCHTDSASLAPKISDSQAGVAFAAPNTWSQKTSPVPGAANAMLHTSCSPTCYFHRQSWRMDPLEFWTSWRMMKGKSAGTPYDYIFHRYTNTTITYIYNIILYIHYMILIWCIYLFIMVKLLVSYN